MTSLPLPGYQVSAASDGTSDVRFVVSHVGSQTTYYFDAESQTTRDRFHSVSNSTAFPLTWKAREGRGKCGNFAGGLGENVVYSASCATVVL